MKQPVVFKITFGRNRYHQHIEMYNWCERHFGYGKWLSGTPNSWVGLEKLNWCVDSMFGNTTFAFKDPKHLSMFLLRWS